MGHAKKAMQEELDKEAVAVSIAIQAGALERCPVHEYVIAGSGDLQAACKLGNYQYTKGELEDSFHDRKEITDFIKNALDTYALAECPACAKNRERD
jgi:uncharacterized protein YlaN (UPF0358 family)